MGCAAGPASRAEPEDVTAVEDALHETGDLTGEAPTGFFGQRTEDAIKRFQDRTGDTADGVVRPGGTADHALREALDEVFEGLPGAPDLPDRNGAETLPGSANVPPRHLKPDDEDNGYLKTWDLPECKAPPGDNPRTHKAICRKPSPIHPGPGPVAGPGGPSHGTRPGLPKWDQPTFDEFPGDHTPEDTPFKEPPARSATNVYLRNAFTEESGANTHMVPFDAADTSSGGEAFARSQARVRAAIRGDAPGGGPVQAPAIGDPGGGTAPGGDGGAPGPVAPPNLTLPGEAVRGPVDAPQIFGDNGDIKIPNSKKQVIGQDESNAFQRALKNDPDLSPIMRNTFHEIFTMEGGFTEHKGASGGITPATLKRQREDIKNVGKQKSPSDLSATQIKDAYKAFFNDRLSKYG